MNLFAAPESINSLQSYVFLPPQKIKDSAYTVQQIEIEFSSERQRASHRQSSSQIKRNAVAPEFRPVDRGVKDNKADSLGPT